MSKQKNRSSILEIRYHTRSSADNGLHVSARRRSREHFVEHSNRSSSLPQHSTANHLDTTSRPPSSTPPQENEYIYKKETVLPKMNAPEPSTGLWNTRLSLMLFISLRLRTSLSWFRSFGAVFSFVAEVIGDLIQSGLKHLRLITKPMGLFITHYIYFLWKWGTFSLCMEAVSLLESIRNLPGNGLNLLRSGLNSSKVLIRFITNSIGWYFNHYIYFLWKWGTFNLFMEVVSLLESIRNLPGNGLNLLWSGLNSLKLLIRPITEPMGWFFKKCMAFLWKWGASFLILGGVLLLFIIGVSITVSISLPPLPLVEGDIKAGTGLLSWLRVETGFWSGIRGGVGVVVGLLMIIAGALVKVTNKQSWSGEFLDTLDSNANLLSFIGDGLSFFGGISAHVGTMLIEIGSFLSHLVYWMKMSWIFGGPLLNLIKDPETRPVGCFIVPEIVVVFIAVNMVQAGGIWAIFGWIVGVAGSFGAIFIGYMVYDWQKTEKEMKKY
jgi:hypothetical protein